MFWFIHLFSSSYDDVNKNQRGFMNYTDNYTKYVAITNVLCIIMKHQFIGDNT